MENSPEKTTDDSAGKPTDKRPPRKFVRVAAVVLALLIGLTVAFAAGLLIGRAAQPSGESFWGQLQDAGVNSVWDRDRRSFNDATLSVLTAIGVLAGLFFVSQFTARMAKKNAKRWADPLLKYQQGEGKDKLIANVSDPALRERLQQQFAEIRGRARHHFEVFADFYRWYFMSISTFSFCALIAAITLFFITKDGWNMGGKLIAVFVVSAAAAAFFKSFIAVYKQPENIADNQRLYKNYLALMNELLSFCAIGESGNTMPTSDFVRHVDQKLAEFNNIAVGFDATKVSSYEGLLSAHDQKSGAQAAHLGGGANGNSNAARDAAGADARNGHPAAATAERARRADEPEKKESASLEAGTGGTPGEAS